MSLAFGHHIFVLFVSRRRCYAYVIVFKYMLCHKSKRGH